MNTQKKRESCDEKNKIRTHNTKYTQRPCRVAKGGKQRRKQQPNILYEGILVFAIHSLSHRRRNRILAERYTRVTQWASLLNV